VIYYTAVIFIHFTQFFLVHGLTACENADILTITLTNRKRTNNVYFFIIFTPNIGTQNIEQVDSDVNTHII